MVVERELLFLQAVVVGHAQFLVVLLVELNGIFGFEFDDSARVVPYCALGDFLDENEIVVVLLELECV